MIILFGTKTEHGKTIVNTSGITCAKKCKPKITLPLLAAFLTKGAIAQDA